MFSVCGHHGAYYRAAERNAFVPRVEENIETRAFLVVAPTLGNSLPFSFNNNI